MSTVEGPSRARRLARLRADRTLARDHERLRRETLGAVRAKLQRSGVHLDDADLEPTYNLAWHTVHAKLAAGEIVENVQGFLVQAAYFRAMDEYRARHVDRRADGADLEVAATVEDDVVERLDDAQSIRTFSEGLRLRLDARECRAAVLCYLHGYSRPDAAKVLGVSPGRIEKIMDRVSKVVRDVVAETRDGDPCDSRRSLVTAYAVGILDPDGPRHVLAAEHVRSCPGCRALVRRLRGLGALVPPVALPWATVGIDGMHLPGAVLGGGSPPPAPSGSTATGGTGRRPRGSQAAVATAVVTAVVVVAGVLAATGGDDPAPRVATADGDGGAGGLLAGAASATSSTAGATVGAAQNAADAARRRAARAAAERADRVARAERAARRRARRAALAKVSGATSGAAAPARAPVSSASVATPPAPAPPAPAQSAPVPPAQSSTPPATAPTAPAASTSPARSTPAPRRETDADQEFGIEP